ncbi:MAG: hypothetical protein SF052_13200 [Bacteroidia bacterium]|nr:hypothetical protein [Bacteroidia bacterium]
MKKSVIIFCFLTGLTLSVSAQVQTWEEKMESMRQRVQMKMENQQRRVDLQFANQMRRMWLQMQFFEGEAAPEIPEPSIPKVYDPAIRIPQNQQEMRVIPDLNLPSDEGLVYAPDLRLNPEPEPEVSAPDPAMEADVNRMNREVQLAYFGKQMALRYDSGMEFEMASVLNVNSIADQWEQLEKTPYEYLVYQLTRQARDLKLNDWGFAILVNETAKQIYPHDKNARTLFNWFVLTKAGYIATVSYEGNQLYLMVPSKHVLYGKSYLQGKEHKLYAIDLDGGNPELLRAKVFQAQHPEAKKVMDFQIKNTPVFPDQSKRKMMNFSYAGKTWAVPVEVNTNLVDFYETYPFVDLEIYMSAPLSASANESMVSALRKIVTEMPLRQGQSREAEGVNLILRFVQTAFPYKPDNEQFGQERYLFGDETLYYPYSDCEDRSVLFAHLVKEIMGLEVVGLLFPGHAATAVQFTTDVPGDYVRYQNKKYVICDPTYINADLGMVLPDVEGQSAKIVAL